MHFTETVLSCEVDFRNVEILLAHDESRGVRGQNFMNFVRWREFHCFAASHSCVQISFRHGAKHSSSGGPFSESRGVE